MQEGEGLRGLFCIFGLCQYGEISVVVIILSLHSFLFSWFISTCVCVIDTFEHKCRA